MIIVLLGASGSGKSTIEKEMINNYGCKKIIPYTTRLPREDEQDGMDYHFVKHETFEKMKSDNLFATCEKYSQKRFYGTLESDFDSDGDIDKIVTLTPNGLRQLKQKYYLDDAIYTVYINCNLGTRIKRYIDRCGVNEFTFDDKNEIAARVERDFTAFMCMEEEVDLVVENNENANIKDIINGIQLCVNEKKKKTHL